MRTISLRLFKSHHKAISTSAVPGSDNPSEAEPERDEENLLNQALLALTPEAQETIRTHLLLHSRDIDDAMAEVHRAASDRQQECQAKKLQWSFHGRTVHLQDEANKVLLWLAKFKSVGDVVAGIDPLHVGLPWAGIKAILTVAVSGAQQMGALLTGIQLALSMSNSLKVYTQYYGRLPSILATKNFRDALVIVYSKVLEFLARALRIYAKNQAARALQALWQPDGLVDFEKHCDKLRSRLELEANNCYRELRSRRHQEAEKWEAELKDQSQALSDDPQLCQKGLEKQFDELLAAPLIEAMRLRELHRDDLFVVFDALDECDPGNDIGTILRLLDSNKSFPLRVFATSRPELDVRSGFMNMSLEMRRDVKLEEIQSVTIEDDIRMYLEHRLQEIRAKYNLIHNFDPLPENWATEGDIRILVQLTSPLFICASTICRYVSGRDPRKRFQAVMQRQQYSSLSGIANTYLPILEQLLVDEEEWERDQIAAEIRGVIGPLVLLADSPFCTIAGYTATDLAGGC